MAEQKRLQRLIASYERKIRNGFLSAVNRAWASVNISELAALIEAGNIEQLLAVSTIIPDEVSAISVAAYLAATDQATREIFEATGTRVVFDDAHENALRIMRNRTFVVLSNFNAKQEAAVREVLLDGIRRGVNPRQQAVAIRASIGLTTNQVKAVNNYRDLLENNSKKVLQRKLRDKRFDRTINRAIREGKTLERVKIDRMVTRYRERYLKYRANTIAQTEALSAVHRGKEEMFNNAILQGHIAAEQLEGTWVTIQDALRRHSHATMHNQKRPHGHMFVSGAGNFLLHPGDPTAPIEEIAHCRCLKVTRIV